MGVSTHPTDSTIVISLWQGDICTGTFRMPAQNAAHLISTLAYGMTEAIPIPDERTRIRDPSGPRSAGSGRESSRRADGQIGPRTEAETHLRLLK